MITRRAGLATIATLQIALLGDARAQSAANAAPLPLRAGVERLEFLRGAWNGTLFAPGQNAEWEQAGQTQFSVSPAMNGLYLETQVRSGQYLYALVFSYDAAQGRYRIVSRDDQSGLLDVYVGAFDDTGALVVSNIDSGTHYRNGDVRIHNRMTFGPLGDGAWVWLVEATADRGATWRPQIRSVAHRAPE